MLQIIDPFPVLQKLFYCILFKSNLSINQNDEVGRGVESDMEGCEIDTSTIHYIFNFPLLVKDKRKFPLCEKERTKANIRWVKSTKGKGIFRLWTESGWRHALVGAEMGKVFLTV